MKRKNRFTLLVLVLIVGCLASISPEVSGGEFEHRSVAAAFEAAQVRQAPVLMLLRVEAHGDSNLGHRVEDSTKKLPVQPVAVELVYPEKAYARPHVAGEFVRWADLVGATRLPALAWVGPDGRPCGLIELDPGAADPWLDDRLKSMHERYQAGVAAHEKARRLDGAARARCLNEYLQFIDPPCRTSYYDVMAQIVRLDPENIAGLRAVYEPVLTEVAINTAIQEQVYPLIDAGAYTQAHEVLGALLRNQPVSDEQRQLLMAFQAQLMHSQDRTPEAIALIDEALAIEVEGSAREKLLRARRQFTSH
ncbi:MAG: hypothetical protein AAF800_03790 [Planctomycetota bacterium]